MNGETKLNLPHEIYLSVVIPAYNEAKRIGKTLGMIRTYLQKQSYAWEVIVVDDGSTDATARLADEQLEGLPNVVLVNPGNRGKGYSVKRGMLQAQGRYVLFSDADLSTPIEEVSAFLKYLEGDRDLVIGSRALPESHVEIHQNILRELMGRTFNLLARVLAYKGIHDSQCGFKCFRREVARDLFGCQKLEGFSFDVEIVYLAQKKGYRLLELPVTWRNSPASRVNVIRDSIGMFVDLLRIRWLHRFETSTKNGSPSVCR